LPPKNIYSNKKTVSEKLTVKAQVSLRDFGSFFPQWEAKLFPALPYSLSFHGFL